MKFFLSMTPPTITAQMHKVICRNNMPHFVKTRKVEEARAQLAGHLAPHMPVEPLKGPLHVVVKWLFPRIKGREHAQYKDTKPDLDNLCKLLFDVMTELHFYQDDAQIASMLIEKFWAEKTGIFIEIDAIRD